MSSAIDWICRFDISYFRPLFKLAKERGEALARKGKEVRLPIPPFKVDEYTYPNLHGVEFTIVYRFEDDLERLTFEWTTPDGKEHRVSVHLYFAPSNLGNGEVPYFVCPHTRRYCRKLFTDGRTIASRYAFPHHYSYQNESRGNRIYTSYHRSDKRGEQARSHRQTYRGEPTRWAKMADREEAKCRLFWGEVEERLERVIQRGRRLTRHGK